MTNILILKKALLADIESRDKERLIATIISQHRADTHEQIEKFMNNFWASVFNKNQNTFTYPLSNISYIKRKFN